MGARCLVTERAVGLALLGAVGSGVDTLFVTWGVLKWSGFEGKRSAIISTFHTTQNSFAVILVTWLFFIHISLKRSAGLWYHPSQTNQMVCMTIQSKNSSKRIHILNTWILVNQNGFRFWGLRILPPKYNLLLHPCLSLCMSCSMIVLLYFFPARHLQGIFTHWFPYAFLFTNPYANQICTPSQFSSWNCLRFHPATYSRLHSIKC